MALLQFSIFAGEVLTIPVPLTDANGDPYPVSGTVVLRITSHWGTVATVEETVDILTDSDTPRVEFADTGGMLGLYTVQLIETTQPLVLHGDPGLLWVRPMILAPAA